MRRIDWGLLMGTSSAGDPVTTALIRTTGNSVALLTASDGL